MTNSQTPSYDHVILFLSNSGGLTVEKKIRKKPLSTPSYDHVILFLSNSGGLTVEKKIRKKPLSVPVTVLPAAAVPWGL